MFNNDKLINRLNKIFKYLKENWGITKYRVAVETNIPHSSLKLMMDGKFEWKLNHILSLIDFLNKYGAETSFTRLFDFKSKKTLSQLISVDKIDFRPLIYSDYPGTMNLLKENKEQPKETINSKKESDALVKEINEFIKGNTIYKKYKISLNIKINLKEFNYSKNLIF